MKHQLRSSFSTQGRRMAGARALWTANGMKKEQMGKPIIAIVNSFTIYSTLSAMRLNIPTVFVSGGPMEAGEWNGQHLDLIDAMIKSADESVGDKEVAQIEQHACPTCGCFSGMFTANSMNCMNEAIGLALPGNGTIVATHENRKRLFEDAAKLIVANAFRYYEEGDESVLPRSIATREAFLNAMTLDIAMGGSTNTVLHLLAVAHEAGADFKMDDIDMLSSTPAVLTTQPS